MTVAIVGSDKILAPWPVPTTTLTPPPPTNFLTVCVITCLIHTKDIVAIVDITIVTGYPTADDHTQLDNLHSCFHFCGELRPVSVRQSEDH